MVLMYSFLKKYLMIDERCKMNKLKYNPTITTVVLFFADSTKW